MLSPDATTGGGALTRNLVMTKRTKLEVVDMKPNAMPNPAPASPTLPSVTRRAFLGVVLANAACSTGQDDPSQQEAVSGGGEAPADPGQSPGGSPGSPSAPPAQPPNTAEGNAGPFIAAPATVLTTTRLLVGASGIYPWCTAQAFSPGDLPFGFELDGVQTVVKNRWPDGSAKVAILAGVTSIGGTSQALNIGIGAAPTGAPLTMASLKATGFTAQFTSDRYGSAEWTTNDWDTTPFISWVSGPVMSSWIVRKPFSNDSHLVAWMELRLWATGHVEVLPWIENGFLLRGSPGGRPDTYALKLSGTEVFRMAMPVYHHTRAPLLSGQRLSYWVGGDKTVTPKHGVQYLYRTGLVQTYMTTLERNYGSISGGRGVSDSFTPYENFAGSVTIHSTNMGQGGGHDSIGVQPAWEAVALVDDSAQAHAQLQRESFRMGQWQIHYRDETTNRAVDFNTRAGVQLNNSDADTLCNVYNREGGGLTATPTIVDGYAGQTGKFARSHQPAAPLLAYLMTGRFWFVDQCQHIAGVNFLSTPATRAGTAYLHCEPSIVPTRMQLREAAWSLRNLAIAACITPDDDPLKAGYDASIDHNIDYYHARYIQPFGSQGMNAMGLIENKGTGTNGGNQAWQYDFWTGAWGRIIAFRVGTSRPQRQKARAFFDWISKSIVGRLGGTGPTEYLYRFATTAANVSPLSSRLFPGSNSGSVGTDYSDGTYPNWNSGSGPWFADWGQFYEKRIVQDQGYTGGKVDGPLMGPDIFETTGWWAMAREAIAVCVALNAPGALAAWSRLRANSVWSTYVLTGRTGIYQDQYPTNGVDATPLALEDFSATTAIVGTRENVNLNSSDEVDYDRLHGGTLAQRWWTGYGGGNSFESMTLSYSGATWAPDYGTAGALVSNGGGHGGFIGAFVYLFDFGTLRWRQVGAPRNLPTNLEWAGYATPPLATRTDTLERRDPDWMDYNYNGSYITFSDHTYLQNAYISPREGGGPNGSLLLPQSTFSQDPGVPDPRTGTSYRWAPHMFSLNDGTMSRATAAPLGGWTAYSNTVAVKDTRRSRIWYFRHGQIVADYHDLTSGPPYTKQSHTIQKVGGGSTDTYFGTYNSTWIYVPEADAVVAFTPDNSGFTPTLDAPLGVGVFSMASGMPVDLKRTDIPRHPMRHSGIFVGVAWCPTLSKFYLYEGMGDSHCTVLTPSSLNFATCTWTWSRENFTGAPPITRFTGDVLSDQIRGVLGRWVWVPALSAFAWHDGPATTGVCNDGVTRRGIVQLWRPPGTPI
jgi:hypothetical protein